MCTHTKEAVTAHVHKLGNLGIVKGYTLVSAQSSVRHATSVVHENSPNSLVLSRSLSELDSSSPNWRQIPVDLIGRPLTLDTRALMSAWVSVSMARGRGEVGGIGESAGGRGEVVGIGEWDGESSTSSSMVCA